MCAEEKHYLNLQDFLNPQGLNVLNPQGLDEILSEILGHPVSGDWDSDFPSERDLEDLKKEQVEGRKGDEWGHRFEECARSYLAKNLLTAGWKQVRKERIGGHEFDCVGWKEEPKDAEHIPDLVIEMYFPRLREKKEYYLDLEKVTKMAHDLDKVSAKFRYMVIGVPHNLRELILDFPTIPPKELPHPPIKMVFQEHKFGSEITKARVDKRKK